MSTDQPREFNPYQATVSGKSPDGDTSFQLEAVGNLAWWQWIAAIVLTIISILTGVYFLVVTALGGSGILNGLFLLGFVFLLFVLPTGALWRATVRTRRFARSGSPEDQASFLAGQIGLWRTIAISTGLAMGLLVVAVIMVFTAFNQISNAIV